MALVRLYTWDLSDNPVEVSVDLGGGFTPTVIHDAETLLVPAEKQVFWRHLRIESGGTVSVESGGYLVSI